MPKLRNLGVWVTVADKKLEEFGHAEKDGKVVSCYIPSEVDQEFRIRVQNSLGTSGISCHIYADGELMAKSYCGANDSTQIKGSYVSPSMRKPFVFSKLNLTDDESSLKSPESWANIGLIEAQLFRVIGVSKAKFTAIQACLANDPVHERSKKAGSHRIGLGKTVKSTAKGVKVTYLDEVTGEPYVKFQFMYRPRALLQAQEIIPAPPPPKHVPHPNAAPGTSKLNKRKNPTEPSSSRKKPRIKSEEGSNPEALARAAKLQKLQEQMQAIQAEIDNEQAELQLFDEDGFPVKREASPIRVPRTSKKRVVIDLTD